MIFLTERRSRVLEIFELSEKYSIENSVLILDLQINV